MYVDDTPASVHELEAYPVMSTVAAADIASVDVSAALAVAGVRRWVSHLDIEGEPTYS